MTKENHSERAHAKLYWRLNKKENHSERAHAKLSASGSSRWLNCPGSVKAEEAYADQSSSFAEEGTLAHEIADLCLKSNLDAEAYVGMTLKELKIKFNTIDENEQISRDMARYVQEYLDYVLSHETKNSTLYTEQRVDFSNIVPDGFGTMDSAILDYDSRICHIFDLKYGKGITVDAFENTQGQMYALGFYNESGFLDDIDSFRIHIVQPRKNNYSYWDISVKNLIKFGKWVSERAELALSKNPIRVPGEKQCQWCKAKADCKVLFKFTENIIMTDFDNLEEENFNNDNDLLTDKQRKTVLDNQKLIELFLKANRDSVFDRIKNGDSFNGYKIVEGKSNRVWRDDAEKILSEKLGDDAYNKKLIGITDAQKKVGKEIVDKVTFKPSGKLTLAPESDKRKAIVILDIVNEFDNLENN